MIPYLLQSYHVVHEARLYAFVALNLKDKNNTMTFDFSKIRKGINLSNKVEIINLVKKLSELKNENNEQLFSHIDIYDKTINLTLTEEGILKFSLLKVYFKQDEYIKRFLNLPSKLCQRFWFLLQDKSFKSFSITAKDLALYLDTDKYRLMQKNAKKNTLLDNIGREYRKIGLSVSYELENEKNIRDGIHFIINKYNQEQDLINIFSDKLKLNTTERLAKNDTLFDVFLDGNSIELSKTKQNIIKKINKINLSQNETKMFIQKLCEFLLSKEK